MSNESNPRELRPFPWKCGKCRQREVHPTEGEYTTELVHDGRSYTVTVPRLQTFRCRNCGETVLDTEANKQISQAFRRQIGLLTPEEIRHNRKKLRLTQGELGERLSVAEATLSRWENGWQIQQRSLDKLMRLFFGLPVVRIPLGKPFEPPMRDRFRHLKNPGPELLKAARNYRLMPQRPDTADNHTEQPKEQSRTTAEMVDSAE